MSGETDLKSLLANLSPELGADTYVFATITHGGAMPDTTPLMQFTEEEGVTLIMARMTAEAAGIPYEFPCRRITLKVHSALDAAGLMAAVSAALAEKGIPVNPVAGYFHDHLFVPEDRAEEALAILRSLAG